MQAISIRWRPISLACRCSVLEGVRAARLWVGRLAPMLLSGLVALVASEARGETALIDLTRPVECATALSASKARLAAIEERLSLAGLRASIAIDRTGTGFRVRLRITRAGEVAGETVVTAPSCEEATDVAAVVLGLAAGSEPKGADEPAPSFPKPVSSGSERTLPEPPRAKPARSAPAPLSVTDRERGTPLHFQLDTAGTRRLALSLGFDAGTLSTPTLVVAGGLAKSFAALELRGALRYGLASVEEELDAGSSEFRRQEFGAFDARVCYGTASSLRVAACGGAELGVLWSSRRVELASGLDEEDQAIAPRLSGTLAALVAHRGGRIQPELECSASGVAFGREAAASWLVLRVSAAAAVAF
jgi:hypothetical protein